MKYQPAAPTVSAGTVFELSVKTFNCVPREVKDEMGVTVSYNGLEYGDIETESGPRTMAGHRIGLLLIMMWIAYTIKPMLDLLLVLLKINSSNWKYLVLDSGQILSKSLERNLKTIVPR